ncbi:MAG: DUF4910 domain-containing protein, partial [Ilumatobacteraceae bacterium]
MRDSSKTSLGDLASRDELFGLVERLYPINRSITGDGVRETLHILG